MNWAVTVGTGLLGVAAGPFLTAQARASLAGTARVPAAPVMIASGGVAAAFGARYAGEWDLPAFLVLAAGLIVISVVDLLELRIPNRVLGPTAVLAVALLTLAAIVEHDGDALVRATIWGAVSGGVFLGLHLLSPRGLGMGDVKLVLLLGFALGMQGGGVVLLAVFLAFGAGAVAALVLLVAHRVRGRDPLPFGPFLAVGALAALLVSGPT